jgi:predicted DNA-binding transcriptional regulator AlpA
MPEVAARCRLSIDTLRFWRHTGKGGPPSFRMGRRVAYFADDVDRWIEEQAATSSSLR